MGLSIYLFAGPADYKAFSGHCRSIGLKFYPILANMPEEHLTDDPAQYPFAYLSVHPMEALHPYGNPSVIGSATDPLLELMKPYLKGNTLVIGRLYCSDDVPEFYAVTRPIFSKLAKWIKKDWRRLPTGQYCGPEADSLMNTGATLAYFPPGPTGQPLTITRVPVGQKRDERTARDS